MPCARSVSARRAIAGSAERLRFEPALERAVAQADVVQETGPERLDFKRDLWRRIAAVAPPHSLLLSSSSGIPATEQAAEMDAPGRMLIGHPFNPPHVIPLVEVVPGAQTSPEAVADAVAFYRAIGKVPQVVRKEIGGFVANRLQAAIFRECVSLVSQGVVTVDELDAIVTHSVGLRWAVDGPFASFHLGGGGRRHARLRAAVRPRARIALALDGTKPGRVRRGHHATAGRAMRGGLRRHIARRAGRPARRAPDRAAAGDRGQGPRFMTGTTDRVRHALAHPRSDSEGFEPHTHLREVLAGVGLAPENSGGAVRFIGRDPILPSVFRIVSAAGIGLAAKSVAMAALWRERGGAGQDIEVDLRRAPHRLCPFYDRKWEKLNGYSPRNVADPDSPFALTFYETRDGRWVMPLNLYPKLKSSRCGCSTAATARGPWPRPFAGAMRASLKRPAPRPAS